MRPRVGGPPRPANPQKALERNRGGHCVHRQRAGSLGGQRQPNPAGHTELGAVGGEASRVLGVRWQLMHRLGLGLYHWANRLSATRCGCCWRGSQILWPAHWAWAWREPVPSFAHETTPGTAALICAVWTLRTPVVRTIRCPRNGGNSKASKTNYSLGTNTHNKT